MEPEILEKYRKAGRIAKQVMAFGKRLIRADAKVLDVVEKIETKIKELGAEPAFPVNLSVNEFAAHDTADIADPRALQTGQLVKLDLGVHVDGYIADVAETVSLSSGKEEMIKAAELALSAALREMVPGKRINEISEVIEKIIRSAGYRPIINLTGHGLDCWDLHARTEVPNVKNDNKYELKAGDVFAIEPFVTDGNGRVIESGRVLIYRWISDAPTRFREGRRILMMARDRWHGLPFTKRWAGITPLRLSMILRDLTHSGALYEYPVLREQARGIIAQAEHTVIVGEKPEVITK